MMGRGPALHWMAYEKKGCFVLTLSDRYIDCQWMIFLGLVQVVRIYQ